MTDTPRPGSGIRPLWIFALVLASAGLMLTMGVQAVYAAQLIGFEGSADQSLLVGLEVGRAIGPSILTAGLISAALALALRAVMHVIGPPAPSGPHGQSEVDLQALDPSDVILGTSDNDRRSS